MSIKDDLKKKLIELKSTPNAMPREVDDPLLTYPMSVIDKDVESGTLTLHLNHIVTELWVKAFRKVGSFGTISLISYNRGPGSIDFKDNKAIINALNTESIDEMKRVIGLFNGYLQIANQLYGDGEKGAALLEAKQLDKNRDEEIARAEKKISDLEKLD